MKKYRELERCLDIQFGSGKRYHSENLLESHDVYEKYIVWERLANEGGSNDSIFTLTVDEKNNWVETTLPQPCLYGFDKIRIFCNQLPAYFEPFNPEAKRSSEYEIKMQGSYFACNSRSFVDLYEDSAFYGSSLGYDPYYASDYFVPTKDGFVNESDVNLVKETFIDPHVHLPKNSRIELHWQNRIVQIIESNNNETISSAADYWDNCLHPEYLAFIKNREQ